MKRLLAVIIVLSAVGLYFWLDFSAQKGQGFSLPPPVVRLDEARLAPVVDIIEAVGTTRAWEAVDITAKTAGKVSAIHFPDNAAVAAGEVIVELDAGTERAQLREAEVILEEDKRLLRHYQTLLKTQAVSKTMLEEQQAKVKAAEARVRAARAELGEFDIVAPFGGYLGVRRVSVGALVTPGTLITTLDDIDPLRLDFTVPERWLGRLDDGLKMQVSTVAYPGEMFDAEITSIGTRIDAVTRAVSVYASLANPEGKLRPGMLLSVRIETNERQGLMISEQALLQEGSYRFVYRVDADRTVHRTEVASGSRRKGMVEIVEGLSAGDSVVAEGTQKIRDGVVVAIAGEQPAPAGEEKQTP